MGGNNNNLEVINLRFKYQGSDCVLGLRFLDEKEMKENEKRRMKYKAEKSKNLDYVASGNKSFPAKMQQDCCSTSSDAKGSPDSPLRIEPLSWRLPSTCYKAPIPLRSDCNHTKEMKCRTEKGKNVVVASNDDDEPSMATQQQHSFSYSTEPTWLPDSRLLIEPSTWRLWPICYENTAPLRNWDQHSTKNGAPSMNDNAVQEQQTKKRQHMATKTREEHQHQKDERKKKKTKTERKRLPLPTSPPRPMPNNLQRAITELGGTNSEWLAEKRMLTISDTNPQLGRLLFPYCGDVLEKYLTAEEKEKLVNPTDDSKGLKVLVVDTSGEQFDVDLRIWGSLKKFVFARNWNKMVETLRMEPESDTIQLWCFRLPADRGSKLCFATNMERGHKNAEVDLLKPRMHKFF